MMNEDKIKNEANALDEAKELDNEDFEDVAGGIRQHRKRRRFKSASETKTDDAEDH